MRPPEGKGKKAGGELYLVGFGGIAISGSDAPEGGQARRKAMGKFIQDPETDTAKRLEELEIKMSFLEKELEDYKEASRGFYRRINELEEEVRKLQKDVQESDLPTPDVTWDSEGGSIRP
jgi:uncharacterized coiled-coil protein SlyX